MAGEISFRALRKPVWILQEGSLLVGRRSEQGEKAKRMLCVCVRGGDE